MRPLAPEDVAEAADVSRETLARLEAYVALLERWQARINLVGRDTLKDVWRRHILDSLQLVPLLRPDEQVVADLGSGAGLPGLVLAIATGRTVHLVESDARKCAFLREAARQTDAPATVHEARIEAATPPAIDLITARALAPLPRLLALVEAFAPPTAEKMVPLLLLKGAHVDAELTETTKYWNIDIERFQSVSDVAASILRVQAYARRSDHRSPR